MVGVSFALIPEIRILDSSKGVTDNGSTYPEPTSYITLGIIPNKKWRVIGLGAILGSDGASTVAESGIFGHDQCDIGDGSSNNNAFGTITQDINAGKQWVNGDVMLHIVANDEISIPDACENNGTHVWTEGELFNVWIENKIAPLRLFKENVAGSTATLYGFVVVEVSR